MAALDGEADAAYCFDGALLSPVREPQILDVQHAARILHRPMADDALTQRLRRLDACAVSDALDRLGIHGVALGIRPLGPRRRIAGRAVTVRLEAATDALRAELAARGAQPRHLCTAAV